MYVLRRSRLLVALSCAISLDASIPALALPESSEPRPAELDAAVGRAREWVKEGDYDKAIDILKTTIDQARDNAATLRDAYLQLVKVYVFLGNDLKFRPQGREASNLNYQEARERIEECLRIKELRHTLPEPVSDYPPEMIALFAEVRSRIFGSFRVVDLEPANAAVLLAGDTLRALPGDSLLGETDLLVGPYLVVVRARGYKDVTDEITISPNSTLERPYRLARKRSPMWYATASTAAVALVVGIAAAARNSGGPGEPDPLPPPPPPPTARRR